MNIKRAFLAATAALMMPSLAMAITATFPTGIDFANNNLDSVNATLTCNTGNPLVQSFALSDLMPVAPVVQEIDPDIAFCTITIDELASGYEATDCEWFPGEGTGVELDNPCLILAVPENNEWTINTVWDNDNPDIDESALIEFGCTNASIDVEGPYIGFEGDFWQTGDNSFGIEFFSAPGESAICIAYADQTLLDSAVEGDGGCLDGTEFSIGSGDDECTITFSVFYEGIPTLSQYGMAIMALLMLGVGFVGFRRFV